jgi:hypothetical protein
MAVSLWLKAVQSIIPPWWWLKEWLIMVVSKSSLVNRESTAYCCSPSLGVSLMLTFKTYYFVYVNSQWPILNSHYYICWQYISVTNQVSEMQVEILHTVKKQFCACTGYYVIKSQVYTGTCLEVYYFNRHWIGHWGLCKRLEGPKM